MPFTFSHPAAILPAAFLPKKYYSLTGLIAGSVAPDFEYFIRLSIQSDYSHTFSGIFWFDLPLAIILAFTYHSIIRDSFVDNIPKFFKSRFELHKEFNWTKYFKRNWLLAIFSIIAGTLSHIIWDSFTHKNGIFVTYFPFLSSHINIIGQHIPVYNIIQHGSSLFGALLLIFYIKSIPYSLKSKSNINIRYWGIVVLITLMVISYRVLIGLEYEKMNSIIISGMTGGLLSLIITPLLLRRKEEVIRQ